MGHFPKNDVGHSGPNVLNLRCPECGQNGSFAGYANINDLQWATIEERQKADGTPHRANVWRHAGLRRCPNSSCQALVFVIESGGQVASSFPPEVIDFDASNLPPKIQKSLEEAIKCEAAGCYRASALMVRRVLEELCEDKQATGSDLRARISALSKVIIVPPELLAAADELRFLGNDAAHVEAKTYDSIGKNEVILAVELTKELLKAVYQFSDLLKRLKDLQRQ